MNKKAPTKAKTQRQTTQPIKNHSSVLRKSRLNNDAEHSTVPPIVNEVLSSSGQPLDPVTRTFMESRFGHNFKNVKVHTSYKSAISADGINAKAYTIGRDIYFGSGQYQPTSLSGLKILAHELAHVVQGGSCENKTNEVRLRGVPDTFEIEAENVSKKIDTGEIFKITNISNTPRLYKSDKNNQIQEPLEPVSSRWAIKIMAAASVGYGEGIIVLICDPKTQVGTAFNYIGLGLGYGIKGSLPGDVSGDSEWKYIDLPAPIKLSDWEGWGTVGSGSAGVAKKGFGMCTLEFKNPRKVNNKIKEPVKITFTGAPLLGLSAGVTWGVWEKSGKNWKMTC